MIILGHPLIPYKPLYKVTKKEKIKKTAPNSTILIDFTDKDLVQYSINQNISLALHVKSLKDACLANALGVKYIVVNESISSEIQNIATEYLFDAKIIVEIDIEDAIEKAAKNLIDGVVFKKSIL